MESPPLAEPETTTHQVRVGTLPLDGGGTLEDVLVVGESWGRLLPDRSNSILVCPTLSSGCHAAGGSPRAGGRHGWWKTMIGPGRPIDTDVWHVVCLSVLGADEGGAGPESIHPQSGRPYHLDFPVVTISDMVRAQKAALENMGIDRLALIVGGCLGGYLAQEWIRQAPAKLRSAIIVGAGMRSSAHTLGRNAVLREHIRRDPKWRDGNYAPDDPPSEGLAHAALSGLLVWMDRETMEQKFGRERLPHAQSSNRFHFEPEFAVEGFVRKVAETGAREWSARSLFYLTRAMDYFDLETPAREQGRPVFSGLHGLPVSIVNYESDWRFPPQEGASLTAALQSGGAAAQQHVFQDKFGHGAFLFDVEQLGALIRKRLEQLSVSACAPA